MKTGTKIVIGVVLSGLLLMGLASFLLPSLSRARELSSRCAARWRSQDAPSAPAGSLPNVDEELWVIQRPKASEEAAYAGPPHCGMLKAKLRVEQQEIPLPLKHTDVRAWITGYIATVEVRQQYHNPYDERIEAVYVFPLPQNAAVNEFIMTIGERRIHGIIREREEAERIYEQAKRQGYVASLMTQERLNMFTQSVANIEPGKKIDLDIKYFHTLSYADGWYEFVFPMVIGPRFNPQGRTDGVGAVARGRHGASNQATEVQYLRPGERSGHDISLAVSIDAGVSIEEVVSPSHVVAVTAPLSQQAEGVLSAFDAIPNKDFVLRYKVAGDWVKSGLMMEEHDEHSYFTLVIHPPETLSALARRPVEMIFVLDCSGSMSGKPIEQAKIAIERALKQLQPDDTFQIIRFSNNASKLGPEPVLATSESVRNGLRYVRSLHGTGGTQMIEGIKAALEFPHDSRRLRFVSFMTDGFIGNETEILREVHDRLGASRMFSFGVGSSPNRYLLNRMAKFGNGAVAYLGLNDDAGRVMDRFFDCISHPALTDIEIDWGGIEVTDVFPERIPALFVGRPVILTGRMRDPTEATIRVTGRVGDLAHEILLSVDPTAESVSRKGIASIWARMKIAGLYDMSTWNPNVGLSKQIKAVALEFGLVSAYTAFVSVDSRIRTTGDQGTTVQVAVPVPDGVKYEMTVQN